MIWWTLIRLILRDYKTRIKVVSNLGSFRNGRVVKLLVAALNDNQDVQEAAAEVLGQLGDARAVEPLVAALKDGDRDVRKAAVKALGQLGDARAVEPLAARLMDTSYWDDDRWWQEKKAPVAQALTTLGWQPKNDTQGVVFAIAQSGLKEAVRLGIVAVETLEMVALNYNAKVVRNEIVKVLGAISDARAIQTLVNLTKDRGVVDEAVKALQTICQNSAGMADNESLLTIAYLGAVYTTVTYSSNDACGGGSWQNTEEVDCSLLRQMARQELIRRGINA